MMPQVESFVRASVILAFALLAMPLLRGRAAAARRLVLSAAFAAALIVPYLPAWHVRDPGYAGLVARVVAEPGVTNPTRDASWAHAVLQIGETARHARGVDALAWLWLFGVVVVAAGRARALFVARGLVRRSSAAPLAWDAAIARAERATGLRAVVRVSSELETAAVSGLCSPIVLVPASSASWPDERRYAVLLHELAHVAAHDLAVQQLAALVCALNWFDPLAWLAARRSRLERELAADEAVLRAGVRASSYAVDLLAIAGHAPAGTTGIGSKPLSKRIAAIVAARRPPLVGRTAAWALCVGTAVLASAAGIACTATVATTPTDTPAPAAHTGPRAATPRVDRGLQAVAERELARAVAEWKADGGTILVLSPKGEVLADAGGRSDRAYVAGSTMKAMLLAAAIDEGAVSESDVFDCSRAHGERGGKVLHDATPLGDVALPDMLAASSNVGFAQIFDRLGGARVDAALRRFHFATPPELASARAGDWDGALAAIGATMTTTPRQVALAYAALADGGDGIVAPSTASRVSALLEAVVASERGTGKRARVTGARVAGKTGTSEWTAADGEKHTYASFVGYVPADRPQYVVFVGVESAARDDAWGGEVAAPVFSRIASVALARTP